MEWLSENWVLALAIGAMAAMHLFGHGHGKHKKEQTAKDRPADGKPADTSGKSVSDDA
jgi:hypothetical protein